MKRLLLTVALLLVVAVATAQVTTSSIRGKVTMNDNNNPMPGATIVALHTPSGTQYGTIANSEGHFVISGMRVGGPYTITVSYIGYNDLV